VGRVLGTKGGSLAKRASTKGLSNMNIILRLTRMREKERGRVHCPEGKKVCMEERGRVEHPGELRKSLVGKEGMVISGFIGVPYKKLVKRKKKKLQWGTSI